jgi:hypothetical protein
MLPAPRLREEALSKIDSDDADTYEKLEMALKRSNLRLDAVKRHRSGRRFNPNEG